MAFYDVASGIVYLALDEGPLHLHGGEHRAVTPRRGVQGGGQGAGVQVSERPLHSMIVHLQCARGVLYL